MISTGLLRSLEAVEAAYLGSRSEDKAAPDKMPLVEKVMTIIRDRIAAMSLAPGARLPSIRRLAETMNVSKSTVVEAYDRLVAEGLSSRAAVPVSTFQSGHVSLLRLPQ